jgi:hypothetical protein
MRESPALLALFERIPNEEAIALAPVTGWLMLGCAVCAAIVLILHREGFRRLWLRAEDPRSMGLFRIAFGLCAMANINGLWEVFEYLFTDEGLFLTDVAREVFAGEQFAGFGHGLDGDPYGFFDGAALWTFLKGPKYSLLFFWDSPRAWWIHWAAFQISITALVVGYQTKYTKWIACFLFHSIILRNSVYWEGTENVFRTFFFYLCLSRCGSAYSVDNMLRCRKLRRKGLLSERGGPGGGAGMPVSEEHPHGLEAIYQRIPAWPRMLVFLQVVAMYCYTGVVKNGSVWWRGDAFYYALNLDHFYRIPPQPLSAIFGTNLFRLNAHIVHAWESLFPLCAFGLVVRFGLREHLPAFSPTERWIHRVAWVGLGLCALAVIEWVYPVHFVQPRDSWWNLQKVQIGFATAWLLGMVLVAWGWHRMRHRPFAFELAGRTRMLDLDTFLKWTTGRRLWIWLGMAFHLHVFIMMNVGWFQPGSMTGFIAYFNGTEIALIGVLVGRWFGRRRLFAPLVPAWVRRGEHPIPPEDPTLHRHPRDTVRLPLAPMVIALGLSVLGVVLQYADILHYGWTLLGIAAFLAGAMFRAAAGHDRRAALEHAPWAHGPLGRFLATCLVIYQVVGVSVWLLPDKDSFAWRGKTHEPFAWWLRTTQTTQGWRMFAPNPPRSNLLLRVLVTDANGETWDMNTDVYADEQRPIPWIWYTRQRKINRRVGGGEGGKGSWYQKWHARYYCRKWALDHDGELPRSVELVKLTYSIPTPEHVSKEGPYDPVERLRTQGKQTSIYTVNCRTEVDGQLPNVIRRRHGLPDSDVESRRWNHLRNKLRRWEAKRARENEAEKK